MALQCHSDRLTPDEKEHLSTLSKEDAYTWIKARKQNIKQLLGELDAIYNLYSPVNRLPNEIFVEIIRHVKARDATRDFPWLKLAGVCRNWRETLLATPILWTTINISHHLAFVQLCLQRSRNALINIHCGWQLFVATNVVLEALLPHTGRVRSFIVDRLDSSSMESLLSGLTGTMPHLERLKLAAETGEQREVTQRFSPFPGQFPRLRSLSLQNISAPWTSSMLVGLSELDLSFSVTHGPALPLEMLLDILETSPRLTLLSMQNCGPTIPAHTASPSSPSRIVRLPELKTLELSEHLPHISSLLTHLVLPADVFIHVCPSNKANGNEELAHPILDIFPNKLPNLATVARTTLFATGDSWCLFEASIDTNIVDSRRLCVELKYPDFDFEEDLFASIMCDIAALLASSPLRCVDFSGNQGYVEDWHWYETLGCLASVEELEVGMYGSVQSFWRVFGSCRDNENLYCPRLECLDMGDIELDEETAGLVIEGLQNRMLHGHRLKTLSYICNKKLPSEMRHAVEMLVDSFK